MKKHLIILLLTACSVGARGQEARVFEEDLWSPEEFPVNYESESEKERKQDLQSWLYSAQFKRLDIKNALENGININRLPEVEMTISGRVKHRAGQALKNGRIVGYNFEDGKTNETEIDNDGRFSLPVYDFSNGDSFFLQAYDKKGNPDQYKYEIDSDTLPAMKNWLRDKTSFMNDAFSQLDLSVYGLDKDNLLPGVVVKGKMKRDNYVPTERFYSTRLIEADEIEKRGIMDFEQLMMCFFSLVEYVSPVSLRVQMNPQKGDDTEPGGIYNRRGRSLIDKKTTIFGEAENKKDERMVILVDGHRCTVEELHYGLDVSSIQSVQILAPWQTLALPNLQGALNGAVVIKTKTSSKKDIPSQGVHYTPEGLANL